ncbi:hypothetical protein SDC9_36955 [bioreactor metagenome]|uniref:Uncharacterized protein n=1 Tax=bioreactor metagenome TaxID=1076179 RepID=A0A644VI38_9ZZZZ|nr:hypothetical protein [Lentimicrobium sp.]MEA5110358.1 hypothetical protein [Lentimicrobium sp.]
METITLIIACISTIILVWEFVIKNYYTKVEIQYYGILDDLINIENGQYVSIIIKNKGFKKIKVTKIFLSNDNKKGGFYFSDFDFPTEIEPSDLHAFFIDGKGTVQFLKEYHYDYVYIEIDHDRKNYTAKRVNIPDSRKFDIMTSISAEYTLYKKKKLISNPPRSQ